MGHHFVLEYQVPLQRCRMEDMVLNGMRWLLLALLLLGLAACASAQTQVDITPRQAAASTRPPAPTDTPAPTHTPLPTVTPPLTAVCTLSANSDVPLTYRPDPRSGQFGVLSAGQQAVMTGQAPGGWLGFDPGVAQAANVGIFRLRWIAPGSDVTQSGSCASLTRYPAISPTACYEMAMADTPIYARPDNSAAVIATLLAGAYTAVNGKTAQGWYQVNLGDGSLAGSHNGETGWFAPAAANFNGHFCSELPVVNP